MCGLQPARERAEGRANAPALAHSQLQPHNPIRKRTQLITDKSLLHAYWAIPGKLLAGEYPGDKGAGKAREKLRYLLKQGVTFILDLTEEGELEPYAELAQDEARRLGRTVEHRRMPICDVSVPTDEHMRCIQQTLSEAFAGGHVVYVHCWGGVGRAGTVVGCCLVERGLSGKDALREIARLREGTSKAHRESPETEAQRRMVREWRPATQPRGHRTDEHFAGCLLGGAVGDALGAPVEFLSIGAIRREYRPQGITDYDSAYGHIGAITDDTQMTMFTAEGLLRAECRSRVKGISDSISVIHRAYIRWLKTQGESSRHEFYQQAMDGWLIGVKALHSRRAPGNTCLSALRAPQMGTMQEPLNDSKGCGGVMRVAPIGLRCEPKQAFELACEAAAITHGHPSGYYSAGCLAAVISHLVAGESLPEAIALTLKQLKKPENKGHEECAHAVEQAVGLWQDKSLTPSPEVVERMGGAWVGEEALAISLYCALVAGGDFAKGVLLAVNHSGDSDSTGAIAGNILGALLGAQSIPQHWLTRLELRAELETLAQDLLTGFEDSEAWGEKYPGW